MKKLLAAVSVAVLSTLTTLPAEAYGYTPTYYNPDGIGGCNAAAYFEEWNANDWYTWDIPALGDGESIELGADKTWSDYWGYHFLASDQYNSPKATFTCNNGTISGGGIGYWAS